MSRATAIPAADHPGESSHSVSTRLMSAGCIAMAKVCRRTTSANSMQTAILSTTPSRLPGWHGPCQDSCKVVRSSRGYPKPQHLQIGREQRRTGRYSSSSITSGSSTSRGCAVTACGLPAPGVVDQLHLQHNAEQTSHHQQQQELEQAHQQQQHDAQSSIAGAAAVSRRALASATAAALAWGSTGLPAWALRTVSTCNPAAAHH